MSDRNENRAVRVDSWGFDTDVPRTRTVSMFGIFLILFGLLLIAGQLFDWAKLGASYLFLALGIVLLLTWLRDRKDAPLYVGVFITALALSDVLSGARVISGNGWGALFLGIGILGIALIRAREHRGSFGALVLGAVVTAWGAADVATNYYRFDADAIVGPALLVLLGLWLVSRNWR